MILYGVMIGRAALEHDVTRCFYPSDQQPALNFGL